MMALKNVVEMMSMFALDKDNKEEEDKSSQLATKVEAVVVSSRRSYILRSSEARGRAKLVAKYQPPKRHSVLAGGNHGIVASRVLAVVLSHPTPHPFTNGKLFEQRELGLATEF